MRALLILTCTLTLLTFQSGVAQSQPDITEYDLKVVLLGTGMPAVDKTGRRFGASILVEAAGQPYVFDCGRGCGIRLAQVYGSAGYKDVDTLLLTHHHSDHTVGIPELYLNGWIQGRKNPFRVWGPEELTTRLITGIRNAYDGEVQSRGFGGKPANRDGLKQQVTVIGGDGVVLEENGVRITAFEVEHYRGRLSLGYRIDYNGRSVVISGDTRPSENLLKHADGVDLLLHEVVDPMTFDEFRAKIPAEAVARGAGTIHTTAEQAGEIFQQSGPRLAAYYHHNADPGEAEELLLQETRKHYSGPLEVGRDMMTILIGDEIEVIAGQ